MPLQRPMPKDCGLRAQDIFTQRPAAAMHYAQRLNFECPGYIYPAPCRCAPYAQRLYFEGPTPYAQRLYFEGPGYIYPAPCRCNALCPKKVLWGPRIYLPSALPLQCTITKDLTLSAESTFTQRSVAACFKTEGCTSNMPKANQRGPLRTRVRRLTSGARIFFTSVLCTAHQRPNERRVPFKNLCLDKGGGHVNVRCEIC